MAIITFIETASQDNNPVDATYPFTVTLTQAQQAGDGLIVLVNGDPAAGAFSISDTTGNTYYPVGSAVQNADYIIKAYVCLDALAAGASSTGINVRQASTPASGNFSVRAYNFRPQAGYQFLIDNYSNVSGNSATVTPGSIPSHFANTVAAAKSGVNSHDTAGAGGSWVTTANDGLGDASQYLISTSIQSAVSGQFTQSAAGIFVAQQVVLAAVLIGGPVEWWWK